MLFWLKQMLRCWKMDIYLASLDIYCVRSKQQPIQQQRCTYFSMIFPPKGKYHNRKIELFWPSNPLLLCWKWPLLPNPFGGHFQQQNSQFPVTAALAAKSLRGGKISCFPSFSLPALLHRRGLRPPKGGLLPTGLPRLKIPARRDGNLKALLSAGWTD